MIKKEQKYVEKCLIRNKNAKRVLKFFARWACKISEVRFVILFKGFVPFFEKFCSEFKKSFVPKNLAPSWSDSCIHVWRQLHAF